MGFYHVDVIYVLYGCILKTSFETNKLCYSCFIERIEIQKEEPIIILKICSRVEI